MLSAEKAGAFYISDCLAGVVRVSHGDDGFVSIGEGGSCDRQHGDHGYEHDGPDPDRDVGQMAMQLTP